MNKYSGDKLSFSQGTDLSSNNDWRLCTGRSLRGHIVNMHLTPGALKNIRVPYYDIGVAEARSSGTKQASGFGLGWVVKQAILRADRPIEQIEADIAKGDSQGWVDPSPITVNEYRHRLVQTMRVISDKGLAVVPWLTIEEFYPGATEVTFDPAVDTFDEPFEQQRPYQPWRPGTYDVASLMAQMRSVGDPSYRVNL